MQALALDHTHPDGIRHRHTTILVAAAAALLEKLEDFAASLGDEEESALRVLVRAGMLAGEGIIEDAGDDVAGYQFDWLRTHFAVHHHHSGVTPPGSTQVVVPPWWPSGGSVPRPGPR
jgi:hypothetical protein